MGSKEHRPRAYTADEIREMFLERVRSIADFWANESKAKTNKERCDGVAFSILNLLDGTTVGFPACDVLVSPHPDDKAYRKERGENWFEPGTMFNDTLLHELYYRQND